MEHIIVNYEMVMGKVDVVVVVGDIVLNYEMVIGETEVVVVVLKMKVVEVVEMVVVINYCCC